MKAEGIVLDTNALISAALSPRGKPFACLCWVLENATLITSGELLDELETRLARPKFKKYVGDKRRRSFLADLALAAVLVKLEGVIQICRDPDDNKVLETALAGRADVIVTGDQDLLVLHPFHRTLILAPAEFLVAIA